MDSKALAKSKRAHSQHHKNKSHPNQKSKAPSASSDNAGSTTKPTGKQVGEKTRQVQRISRLPSNWDRYIDEFDLDGEDQSGDSTSQSSDVVVPKSKGADYSYLIAEAQSYCYSDRFPSLEDVMPGGFIEGVGSMLSVRGEGILSWLGEDNFIVDNKTTSVQEASFLSLNLNALAEQLAKVDLSQRLFIEADLLPPELGAEGSMARIDDEHGQIETTHESEAAADISDDGAFNGLSEKVEVADTAFTSFSSRTYHKDATFHSRGPDLVNQVKDGLTFSHFDKSAQSRVLESTVKFEAAPAEAEVDMLLDSFIDSKFLDSSGYKANHNFTKSQQECSAAPPQPSGHPVTAIFDDVLDDLLQETSNLMNQSQEVKVVPHDTRSSSHSVTNSKLPQLSRNPVTTSFDDVLDDLLQESSTMMSHLQDVKVVTDDTQSSSNSVTKSKVLDDFDSWLDTI
ncbi:hypothetical protein Patl1_02343 [Pistacia atlantica]|uniref:Uncharacterized protein n=1 Tax=Pistacia atlantica TaxID=434234 RepID=A0ACC1C8Q6_9ROSI|nr:hypothetical protein Patl1_02343 [Pistacia atlantica]